MKHFRDYREIARHVVALWCSTETGSVMEGHGGYSVAEMFDLAESIEDEACVRQEAFLKAQAEKYASSPAPRPK